MQTFNPAVFGARLCAARHAKHWSKVTLAEKAGIKYAHTLSYMEKGGKAGVNAATLMKLAQALDVSSDYLLGLADNLS